MNVIDIIEDDDIINIIEDDDDTIPKKIPNVSYGFLY